LHSTKKAEHTKEFILRQLGHLQLLDKTRRFPSPSHEGFSFVGRVPNANTKSRLI